MDVSSQHDDVGLPHGWGWRREWRYCQVQVGEDQEFHA
jgi:hypothetical protein